MMRRFNLNRNLLSQMLTIVIAFVWLFFGLFCKVLNLVPRHQQIVSEVFGEYYSRFLIKSIGILEIVMFFWVLSKYKAKLNAVVQIIVIMTMNIIETLWFQDLLLWGKFNFYFALSFSGLIYYNEFILKKPLLI